MKNTKLLVLVKKAKNQNQKAFAKLCELKVNEVIFLCVREMGNLADGQDAAQEVFIQMQKSLPALRDAEAFNVWLNRLIHYTCLSMKRKNIRHSDMLGAEAFEDFIMDETLAAMPQQYVEAAEKRQKIMDIIDELPESYRRCITLHYYQHLSYAEIAQVLDMDKDAVNNNMRMARRYIKRQLEAVDGPGSYTGAFSLVAGPLVAQALAEAAELTVSAGIARQCIAAVAVGTAATTGAGLAAGFATKVAAVVAAVVVATSAGAGLYTVATGNGSSPPPASAQPAGAAITALPTESTAANALAGHVTLARAEGTDPTAQNGLAGVALALVHADEPETVLFTTTTATDGSFVFGSLPDGAYRLRITLPAGAAVATGSMAGVLFSEQDASSWITLQQESVFYLSHDATVDELDLELTLEAVLTGRLALTQGGESLPYQQGLLPLLYMELYDPQGHLVAVTTITEEGEYRFDNPMIAQQGTYLLRVAVAGEAAVVINIPDREIELAPGQTVGEL